MSFGYIGDTSTSVKQQVKNKGILTTQESFDLERQGFLGGSLEFIQSQSFSSTVTAIDFTSIKEDVYDVHFLTCSNFKTASDNNKKVGIQLYESGTLETASVYDFALERVATNANTEEKSTGSNTMQVCTSATGGGVGKPENFYCYLYNLGNSSKFSFITSHAFGTDAFAGAGTVMNTIFGGGLLPQTSTVDGIRITTNTGVDLLDFNISLFGVKQL